MSKIKLEDTGQDIILKMSDGNPGAMRVLMEIIAHGAEIDPEAFGGGISTVLMLDTFEIYGTDIYVLYDDKCGRDLRKMIMLLRACQLGHLSRTVLQGIAHDQSRTVAISDEEIEELDTKVCDQLKEFKRAS